MIKASFSPTPRVFEANLAAGSSVIELDHTKLKNLDAPDQHPINAIINLEGELDELGNRALTLAEIDELLY